MAWRVISLQIKHNNIIRGVNKCNEDKISLTFIDLSHKSVWVDFELSKGHNLMP